ncbi:unnamed protein product [Mytilus coruscus]|uniref:Uncharacterized protein n=1 Tax=Mytilus coruscus TaxID=42192 RepID=A0A6J8DQV7_MYTCO|nr:unnamed protein product [Mytilus coruscus]
MEDKTKLVNPQHENSKKKTERLTKSLQEKEKCKVTDNKTHLKPTNIHLAMVEENNTTAEETNVKATYVQLPMVKENSVVNSVLQTPNLKNAKKDSVSKKLSIMNIEMQHRLSIHELRRKHQLEVNELKTKITSPSQGYGQQTTTPGHYPTAQQTPTYIQPTMHNVQNIIRI